MYLITDDALELRAFDGPPTDRNTIDLNVGTQGRAVAQQTDIHVSDTTVAKGCRPHVEQTKSELVTLIRRHDIILGVIDVESDVPGRFGAAEQRAVKEVADGLAALL
jgi:putative methionine-R-sulfoxide reductase with GAF domain